MFLDFKKRKLFKPSQPKSWDITPRLHKKSFSQQKKKAKKANFIIKKESEVPFNIEDEAPNKNGLS